MMRRLRDETVTRRQFESLSEEDARGVAVRGVFVDRDLPEYTHLYDQIIQRAQAGIA
jgi:hypothetical protein